MGAETQRVGDIFIRLGMLDAEKLHRVIERQQELRAQGYPARVGEVAVELGFLRPEQVKRVLSHEGTALLKCPQCDHRYTVPNFQANRRYKCGKCKIYLEFAKDAKVATSSSPPTIEALPAPPQPGPPPPMGNLFIGKTLGSYRLLRLLGKGGMGSVFEGEHLQTKEKAAIKILAEQYTRMPDVVKRFKREATAGGKLAHPNIVQMVDIDEQDGMFYIVSEFVDGLSLEKLLLEERHLAPDRAVRIVKGILAGLQHAHDLGIIHRDIKPANILLTRDETPKLIDFGIAKDVESQTMLTLAGSVLGSPAYMSPEQAQGGEVGPTTDVYSCGVVFFVLLVGRKPFEGGNLVETLSMHVNDPVPSLRQRQPGVPEALERIVHRMMAKLPAQRYPSANAVIAALEKAARGATVRAEGPAKLPDWMWLAGLGGALIFVILAIWWILS
ncbi:MAG: serine/threonine protein kinase [Planctomycetes bacterium]|nr:serine/threonine protein kinase [Planctomycetota bacterium]